MSRSGDPIAFINAHQNLIFTVLGVLGMVLLLFFLIRIPVQRAGGWKASAHAIRREAAATRHAFGAPLRALRAHRKALRLLVRRLRSPHTWRDAERAVTAARQAAAPGAAADRAPRPYAALVDGDTVTVLCAGTAADAPGAPWSEDPADPRRWTVRREDLPAVAPSPGDGPPLLVAVGVAEGRRCAFLDLASGPALTAVEGDARTAPALVRALTAQLDARLPEGLVTVAEGVHPRHPGAPVREAYRAARETEPRHGIAPVLAAAELPDPLPDDFGHSPGGPPRLRIVVPGRPRGHARRLLTDRHGQLLLTGTSLLTSANALGAALSRVLSDLPPVLPPPPAAGTADGHPDALFDEDTAEATAAVGSRVPAPAERRPAPTVTTVKSAAAEPAAPGASARSGAAGAPGVSARAAAADTAPDAADGFPGQAAPADRGQEATGGAARPAARS
ncbi:hypothetical protein [Streptomyces catenulae]|uniref:Type VII secretion protein EccE n=1 Tax=Streptomyces catenulae TaxID=66875 RepID=A0ABV2YZ52_9ACTN|nr:hypothetical protein [Streptomyces catenulae]